MGSKSSAPAAPDYTPIAQSDEQAAQMEYNLGEQQLDYAKQQNAQDQGIAQQVVNADLNTQAAQNASAAQEQSFYDQTYQPIEQQFAQQALDYNSPQMQAQQEGMAGEAVASSFDGQRAQAQSQLASMGIDPSQARSQAIDSQLATVQAASQAGAMNQARLNTQQTGLSLEDTAINVGRGYPTAVTNQYNSGTGAGTAASGTTNQTSATGSNMLSAGAETYGLGTAANNAATNTLNTGYTDSLNEFNANQNASSGIGSILGTGLGVLGATGAFGESGYLTSALGLAEGGPVPYDASPSNGVNVDDIPARLNAGEFVMPRDVVAFEGVKKMQGIVDSARKRMGLPVGGSSPNNQPSAPQGQDLPPGSSPLPQGSSAGRVPGAADSGTQGTAPLGSSLVPTPRSNVPTHMSRRVPGPMRSMQSVGLPI